MDLPFVFSKERLGDGVLSAWVDAEWATCRTSRRSVSGYVVCMGDVPVSWASTRQVGVASSSCEAEYVAISDCVRRACELRNFLTSICRKPAGPTVVHTTTTHTLPMARASAGARGLTTEDGARSTQTSSSAGSKGVWL